MKSSCPLLNEYKVIYCGYRWAEGAFRHDSDPFTGKDRELDHVMACRRLLEFLLTYTPEDQEQDEAGEQPVLIQQSLVR